MAAAALAAALALAPLGPSATAFEAEALESVVSLLPHWPGRPEGGSPQRPPGVAPEASAVAVAPDGYLATAYHAIAPAEAVDVRLADGRIRSAEVVGVDPATDIALLKIEVDLPVPPMVDAPEIELGASVCAIGNAFGLGLSVTCGVVSALRRSNTGFNEIEDFIQTDTAVNPGMSGGALVDEEGRLVGLLSAIFASGADTSAGVNFAVSAKLLRRVALDLQEQGEVRRGKSGLRVRDQTREEQKSAVGAVVRRIADEGPAARAGLQEEDLIIEVAGRPIRSAADVNTAIQLHRPGESFYLTYRRGSTAETITLTLE